MEYWNVVELVPESITVSIVSHGQGKLVSDLLEDLARCDGVSAVLLTQNVPEAEILCPKSLLSRVQIIRNSEPKGFAANHNQAFQYCRTSMFAVLNPDIRLMSDPFPSLAENLIKSNAGVIAPVVCSPEGRLEDSARHFPTVAQLIGKLLGREDGRIQPHGAPPILVDWTAGMFMLFLTNAYRRIGGFDERFFLYYEDVDICARLWKAGMSVALHTEVSVVHAAQRASHRKPRYMIWHLSSMARYFLKHAWRLPRQKAGL